MLLVSLLGRRFGGGRGRGLGGGRGGWFGGGQGGGLGGARTCRLHWLGGRAASGGRGHARLHIVGFDDRLRDIDRLSVPDHRTTGPLLRRIDDDAVAVLARVLHDHGSHLGQDAITDLTLLTLEFFLRVLRRPLEALLLVPI